MNLDVDADFSKALDKPHGPTSLSPNATASPVKIALRLQAREPRQMLLVPQPSRVVTIANFDAGRAGTRVTGGGAESNPMEALALVAKLLAQNKLVIKVETFPFDHAAEAYRLSQGGHVRGKLVLLPGPWPG